MTTSVATRPEINAQLLIETLIASHGDIDLAAERISTSLQLTDSPLSGRDLAGYLPTINLTDLSAGIKVARLLKAYDTFSTLNMVVLKTLDELPPQNRAKLLVELMDRLEVILNPPVQPTSATTINVLNNMNAAQEDAYQELERRMRSIDATVIPPEAPTDQA